MHLTKTYLEHKQWYRCRCRWEWSCNYPWSWCCCDHCNFYKNPSRKCNITITVTAENGLLSTEDLDDFDLKDGDRLMIIAHPDDDLLWGGGNMIQEIKELKETGNNYFVVCLTNGSYDSRARDFDSAMNDIGQNMWFSAILTSIADIRLHGILILTISHRISGVSWIIVTGARS